MKVEKKGTDRKNLLVHIKYHLLGANIFYLWKKHLPVHISFTCANILYFCKDHLLVCTSHLLALLVQISFTFAKITYL